MDVPNHNDAKAEADVSELPLESSDAIKVDTSSTELVERKLSDLSGEPDCPSAEEQKAKRKKKIIIYTAIGVAVAAVIGLAVGLTVYFVNSGPITYKVPPSWMLTGNETTGEPVPQLKSSMRWINLAWCPTETFGGYDMPESANNVCQDLSLSKSAADSFDIINVDLFNTDEETIREYRSWGKIVSCYFSAGSSEVWREDVALNKKAWKAVQGNSMAEWHDEKWLDLRYLDTNKHENGPGIKEMMAYRLAWAAKKGCQLVEPDNVDCWDNHGLDIDGQKTGETCYNGMPHFDANDTSTWDAYNLQIEYTSWMAAEAHARGLGMGLKNDWRQVAQNASLVKLFEFSSAENCYLTNECGNLKAFTDAGKPIFDHEYWFSPKAYLPFDAEENVMPDKVLMSSSVWQQHCQKAKDAKIQLQGPSCLGSDCANTKYQGPVWSYCDQDASNGALTPQ